MSEQDIVAEQQKLLVNTVMRTMTLPLGRGLFMLSTCPPRLTELIPIPPLILDGKIKNR